ncbi:MAG: winged helix-turn-helix domain-containing protein [Candidatus Bilamarchaeaceae archaeon]
MDEVVIDRALLKAIGAESRISILKSLLERRKTQSELADGLSLSAPTVLEHLDHLENAGLVQKIDEGRKWKYYELTPKGKQLVKPSKVPIQAFLVLAFGLVMMFASFMLMPGMGLQAIPQDMGMHEDTMLTANAEPVSAPMAAKAAPSHYAQETPPDRQMETTEYAAGAGNAQPQMPPGYLVDPNLIYGLMLFGAGATMLGAFMVWKAGRK